MKKNCLINFLLLFTITILYFGDDDQLQTNQNTDQLQTNQNTITQHEENNITIP